MKGDNINQNEDGGFFCVLLFLRDYGIFLVLFICFLWLIFFYISSEQIFILKVDGTKSIIVLVIIFV